MTFRTNALKVQAFAGALFGVQVGTTTMAQVNADITSGGFTNTLNSYYTSSFGNVANATVAASVAANLGLTGDALASGAAYITAQLNAAAANARGAVISTILDQFAGLTADATFGAAATAYNTKVTAANAYTGTDNVAIGTVVTTSSVFTLTVGADSFAGTTGNDTVNASLVYATGATTVDTTSTLNVSDQLIGGAGTDTLNVTISGGNAATFVPANITGFEVLNLRNVAGVANSLDASTISGLTQVNADRGNSALTLTNLPAGSSFGLIGNGSTVNAAAQAVGYATGATVTAATINLSGGTLGASAITLTGANLLSTTINSTGAANVTGAFVDAASSKALTINATTGLTTGTIGDSAARTAITINATGDVTTGAVTSSAATTAAITGAGKVTTDLNAVVAPTITVAGSGAVSIGTLNAASLTLTSTQTGGSLTATMNGVATTKVTGGAGNDVITTGAVLTTGFANGGDGTDTLVLGAVGHANTTTLAAKYTNFETLRVNGTFDTSLMPTLTAVQLSGATNNISGMTATQAANVSARADIGGTTLALAAATGTADVASITFGLGTTTAAATNAGALVVTGFETLNIIANPGPTAATAANLLTTVASLTGATLNKVNMTGSAVAITNAATTVATTFDASALTGDANTTNGVTAAATKGLTLGGDLASGSTVTGSNFIDTITLGATGAAGSAYNTGAGADAISTTFANLRTASVYNLVDGGAGTDTVTISDGAGVALTAVDADFKGLTNIEKITVTSTTTAAQSITTGGFFDTNFKTVGSTLTTTSTTGAIVVDQSTFSGTNAVTATSTTGTITISGGAGNNTIVATSVGTAAGEGTQIITTLGGNDTVTSTSAAANTTTNQISTGAGNDTIVGGLGIDLITGGTGVDTMTGGGAVDTFVFAANGSLVSAGLDIITDMGTTDILRFGSGTLVLLAADATALVAGTNVQQSAGGLLTFATADNSLALKTAAVQADTQLDAAQSVAFFVDSGNTYVYYSGAAIGNTDDQIVQLTGVTGLATITVGGASAASMVIA